MASFTAPADITAQPTDNSPPWHAAFPSPRTIEVDAIQRDELLARFKAGERPGKDFVLVDLRRNDHAGGTIKGSLNLPAQTVFYSLSTLLTVCEAAHIKLVIWYCGSSRGRGSRAAAWFRDHIEAEGKSSTVQSVILEGGIKGWVAGGEEFTEMMEGYDGAAWSA